MKEINEILCPIDFSDCANAALERAVQFARSFDARLTLLHVYHIPLYAVPDGIGYSAGSPGAIFDHLRQFKTELMERLSVLEHKVDTEGVEREALVVEGVPFQAIVDTAKDRKTDLIVMGTHGRTGFAHLMLGSVAERVVNLAPCPVLTVPKAPDEESATG